MITTKDEGKLKSLLKEEFKDFQHICIKEEQLGRMEEKINNLVLSSAAHTKVIADFLYWQSSHDGELRGKKQEKNEKDIADNLTRQKKQDLFWKIATIVTIIITGLGIYLGVK
jgi:hypothetical protein